MSDPTNIDIKIKTSADSTGAKQAADDLKNVTKEADKGADASVSQAKKVGRAKDSFEALSKLLRGDLTGALFQAQRASAALGRAVAIAMGPVGLAIGILGSLAIAAKKAFDEERENKLKADADAAKAALEETKAKADELDKAKATALEQSLRDAEKAAQDALAALQALANYRKALIDADEAVALAEIDADASLSDVEKTKRRRDVSSKARDARAKNELEAIDTAARQRGEGIAGARGEVAGQDAEVARAQRERDRIAARGPAQIRAEREANQSEFNRVSNDGTMGRNEKQQKLEELIQRRADLTEELAAAELSHAGQMEIAEAKLRAALDRRAKAAEALAAKEEADSKATEQEGLRRRTLELERATSTKVEAIKAPAEDAAAAERDRARRERELAEVEPNVVRGALSRVRNPVDLNADQEASVARRAIEINKNALAQEGRQAGETIGEALGLALQEAFPQVSNAILANLRGYVDSAIKAETQRIDSQIRNLRTR